MSAVDGIDPTAPPSGTGCVECEEAGGWWFHLRRCAQCGHIGCCDDSPARHAARETAAGLGAAPLLERIDALTGRERSATAAAADRVTPLTARERDVLRLLALGHSNRRIGEELFITGKTASVHVSDILAKLGAAGRTEAVAIAHRRGLLAPEPAGPG